MLRAFRRAWLTRLLSVAALACVVSLSGLSLLHDAGDDTACDPVLVIHDHAAHRLGADNGTSHNTPDHCFICHWHSLRTVGSVAVHHEPPSQADSLLVQSVGGARSSVVSRRSPRAPPTSLL